jgi:anthranilate/para-aminobenzoate synthase component II
MSGGMKYADVGIDPSVGVFDPTLACVVLGSILAQRATEAAVETARRLEAEEAVLEAGLRQSKFGVTPVAESVRNLLEKNKSNVIPADHSALCRRLGNADAALTAARTHLSLAEAAMELERIEKDIARARVRKEAEDTRTGRTPSMNTLRTRFAELKQQVGSLLDSPDGGPLGPAGAAAIRTAMTQTAAALQTTNESMVLGKLDAFQTAVQNFEDTLREQTEIRERQKALLVQVTREADALIAGLQADPIVMRWHSAAVSTLEHDFALETVSEKSNAQSAMQNLVLARETAAKIVKDANSAQIKADQRDYVAKCISLTLEDMGFVVAPPIEEHPGHPATASIVHAATVSGKAIAVSVPIEGQVWYNVEGYVKTVEATVGGGHAAVCDEAESVIEQMHEALAGEFHVQMGELQWDGKIPNRKLRAAKSRPQNGTSFRKNS